MDEQEEVGGRGVACSPPSPPTAMALYQLEPVEPMDLMVPTGIE